MVSHKMVSSRNVIVLTLLVVLGISLTETGATVVEDPCLYPKWSNGVYNITLEVEGVERIVQLSVPYTSHGGTVLGPPTEPSPLLVSFHGCNDHFPIQTYHGDITRTLDAVRDLSSSLTPWYSMIPLGTESPIGYGWNSPGVKCSKPFINDTAFALAMLDFAEAELCVDSARKYLMGFSTGGFLSYGLACDLGRKHFAAIAVGSGSLSKLALQQCASNPLAGTAEGAVPVISYHSVDDNVVPYDGNIGWASQAEVDAMFRARNGCSSEVAPVVTYSSPTTTCLSWNCTLAPVQSCTVSGGLGHCWVGGRSGGFPECVPRTGDVDATSWSLNFFSL
mmetsp:Transcript_13215/g.37527  ORF Transcript_13215/g.37527 Transcript_13215/m.37527 type:complete len:335 (-) Transcript_13215:2169-3173(-)